jgi:hypothetical protein
LLQLAGSAAYQGSCLAGFFESRSRDQARALDWLKNGHCLLLSWQADRLRTCLRGRYPPNHRALPERK